MISQDGILHAGGSMNGVHLFELLDGRSMPRVKGDMTGDVTDIGASLISFTYALGSSEAASLANRFIIFWISTLYFRLTHSHAPAERRCPREYCGYVNEPISSRIDGYHQYALFSGRALRRSRSRLSRPSAAQTRT